LVARRAHNPKAVGSNPAPATNYKFSKKNPNFGVFLYDKFAVLISDRDIELFDIY